MVDHVALKDILGPPMFDHEVSARRRHRRGVLVFPVLLLFLFVPQVSERLTLPGVAVGLAWTPLGGELMFVEASRMEGDGQLTLTGQLGDVMKESAHLAISWLRTNAARYQLTNRECLAPPPYAAPTETDRRVSPNSDGGSGSAGGDRHPPPLPCGGGDEGRPLCRRYHSNLPGVPVQRAPGPVGRGHDRGDHPQGAGAAGGSPPPPPEVHLCPHL